MRENEHKIQVALFRWLKLQHPKAYDLAYAIPNGGKRHIAAAKKLKAEGVKSGVPDMFIALPRNGFHGLYIELKDIKGNNPTDNQIEWLEKLADQGYCCHVCKGLDAAIEAINNYLR